MEIAINEAKGKLSGLISSAEAGENVILTRHGRPVAKIVPIAENNNDEDKKQLLKEILNKAHEKLSRTQKSDHDFLYGDDGLPI